MNMNTNSVDGINKVDICCPVCSNNLLDNNIEIICNKCNAVYPVVDGSPVLLTPDNPLFSRDEIKSMSRSGFSQGWVYKLGKVLPSPNLDKWAFEAESRLHEYVGEMKERCLIVGAGDNQKQNQYLNRIFDKVVITDVSLGPQVAYVCDGHALPFKDGYFDCVILNAVLEHVINPQKVISEVGRILKEGGIVIARTPFMQQVHMGAYDFQRFTDLGHRWLFREFEEIDRGAVGGAGSSLVWSLMYFFTSFCSTKRCALIMKAIARILFFWLKYFDYLEKKGVMDSAVGYYFIGRYSKSNHLSEMELINLYRGVDK